MPSIEDFMLPCLNKKFFGLECMGCGMQRAMALVFYGQFEAAFKIYPAIYTIFLLLAVVGLNFFIKFKYDFQLKIGLIVLNAVIIVVSYFMKMYQFI